jgi:hypothetical protein
VFEVNPFIVTFVVNDTIVSAFVGTEVEKTVGEEVGIEDGWIIKVVVVVGIDDGKSVGTEVGIIVGTKSVGTEVGIIVGTK